MQRNTRVAAITRKVFYKSRSSEPANARSARPDMARLARAGTGTGDLAAAILEAPALAVAVAPPEQPDEPLPASSISSKAAAPAPIKVDATDADKGCRLQSRVDLITAHRGEVRAPAPPR